MAQFTRRFLFPTLSLAAVLFAAAGCDSPQQNRLSGDIERPEPRPIALQGETTFFAGRLLATATVGRGLRGGPGKTGGDDEGGGGSRRGGGGGRGRRGGSRGESGGGGDDSGPAMRGIHSGSRLPPVVLRLHLRNLSKESLDIRVLDVNSDLGNFVARPDRAELAPDQVVDLDPMISQLGAAGDEMPLTVRLGAGKEKEERVINLRTTVPPAPPATAAPPSAATPPSAPN